MGYEAAIIRRTIVRRLMRKPLAPLVIGLASCLIGSGTAVASEDLVRLLDAKSCTGCKLQDADLTFADLRDAQLAKRNCNAPI